MSMKTNNNIVYDCKYHVVFCPKYRRPVIVDKVEARLKELFLEKANELNAQIIEMETMPDRVHLLIACDPQFGIHRVIKQIKGYSASVIRKEFPFLKSRMPNMWTNSYFCSTVGSVSLEVVKQYIENQKNV